MNKSRAYKEGRAFRQAARYGNLNTVQRCLEPQETAAQQQQQQLQPLEKSGVESAAATAEVVMTPLDTRRALLNGADLKRGWTALHSATIQGHAHIVKYLLTFEELDLFAVDMYGRTALHWSAMNRKCLPVLKLLLSAALIVGERPTLSARKLTPRRHSNPIPQTTAADMIVAEEKPTPPRKMPARARRHSNPLPEVEGFLWNVADKYGETALHYACQQMNLEAVRLMIERIPPADLDINLRSSKNNTALHIAASRSQLEVVQVLAQHPYLDVEAIDARGRTALQLAPAKLKDNYKQILESKLKEQQDAREHQETPKEPEEENDTPQNDENNGVRSLETPENLDSSNNSVNSDAPENQDSSNNSINSDAALDGNPEDLVADDSTDFMRDDSLNTCTPCEEEDDALSCEKEGASAAGKDTPASNGSHRTGPVSVDGDDSDDESDKARVGKGSSLSVTFHPSTVFRQKVSKASKKEVNHKNDASRSHLLEKVLAENEDIREILEILQDRLDVVDVRQDQLRKHQKEMADGVQNLRSSEAHQARGKNQSSWSARFWMWTVICFMLLLLWIRSGTFFPFCHTVISTIAWSHAPKPRNNVQPTRKSSYFGSSLWGWRSSPSALPSGESDPKDLDTLRIEVKQLQQQLQELQRTVQNSADTQRTHSSSRTAKAA